MSELQKLIPQLEETIEKKDRLLRQAQSQIESQVKRITILETEVKCLQVGY
jgi:flagellar biosynthesis chaperone FliJ